MLVLGGLISSCRVVSSSFRSLTMLSVEDRVTGELAHDFDLILLSAVVELAGRGGGDTVNKCAGDDFCLVDFPLLGTV